MRKYSLPVRAAALLCALCLLLTGCGTVAAPDDSGEPGTPAPTAEPAAAAAPAADETELTTEDTELTDVEKLAAQLAVKHLGTADTSTTTSNIRESTTSWTSSGTCSQITSRITTSP